MRVLSHRLARLQRDLAERPNCVVADGNILRLEIAEENWHKSVNLRLHMAVARFDKIAKKRERALSDLFCAVLKHLRCKVCVHIRLFCCRAAVLPERKCT